MLFGKDVGGLKVSPPLETVSRNINTIPLVDG